MWAAAESTVWERVMEGEEEKERVVSRSSGTSSLRRMAKKLSGTGSVSVKDKP